jgi:hypothetical protein
VEEFFEMIVHDTAQRLLLRETHPSFGEHDHSPSSAGKRAAPRWCDVMMLFVFASLAAGCSSHRTTTERLHLEYPPELGVVLRDHWGWSPGERTLPNHRINRITIHHGGEDFAQDSDVRAYLRKLQSWSRTEKNWVDIPYHFMIDLAGTIYEVRPINLPGDTNTNYDVTGHALICVIGNYENQILSRQQLNSLVDCLVFLAKRFSVPADSIKGHKDYTETLCPGRDLYRYLQDGSLVNSVKEKLNHQ